MEDAGMKGAGTAVASPRTDGTGGTKEVPGEKALRLAMTLAAGNGTDGWQWPDGWQLARQLAWTLVAGKDLGG